MSRRSARCGGCGAGKRACEISSVVEMRLARDLRPATTWSTAMLTPRRRSIGFSPAATLLLPSLKMARVSTVAVVVPAVAASASMREEGPELILLWCPVFPQRFHSWQSSCAPRAGKALMVLDG